MGIRPQRWRVVEVREVAVGRRRWEDLWVEEVCLRVAAWAPVLASMLVEMAYDRQGDVADCPEVLSSSNRYRERQDMMSEFARDCLKAEEGGVVRKKELVAAFRMWAGDNGFRKMPSREVTEFMVKTYGPPQGAANGWEGVKCVYGDEDEGIDDS